MADGKKERRGGSRPGSGRKPAVEGEKLVGVTVYLSPGVAERFRELRRTDKGANAKVRAFFARLTRKPPVKS